MIDKENEIYTRLRKAILKEFPKATTSSTYVRSESSFPFVQIVQVDSTEPIQYIDSSLEEKFTQIVLQIDIYSDNKTKAKSECKNIAKVIDDTLKKMNFRREMYSNIPNLHDATIYRLTLRYQGLASKDNFYIA